MYFWFDECVLLRKKNPNVDLKQAWMKVKQSSKNNITEFRGKFRPLQSSDLHPILVALLLILLEYFTSHT